MNLDAELNHFARNVISDVYEYFLQNIYSCFEGGGYMDPRCSLYSKFGQLTIIQYLNDTISKEEVISQLIDPRLLGIEDIDNVFDNTVAEIIAGSEDGHAAFYKTCARIVVQGIFAVMCSSFTVSKINKAIVEIAKQAHHRYSLDPVYDLARNDAQSILYTFYKISEIDISHYFTPIENEIGYTELGISNKFHEFIHENLPKTLKGIGDFPHVSVMDSAKFDLLAEKFLIGFLLDSTTQMSNSNDNFLYLAFYFCFISVHCYISGFQNGIRNAIDTIVKMIILENNHKFIRRYSSDNGEQ